MRFNILTEGGSVIAVSDSLVWLNFTKVQGRQLTGEGVGPARPLAWRVVAMRYGEVYVLAEVRPYKRRAGAQMDYVRRVLVARERRGWYSMPPENWPPKIQLAT